MTDTRNQKLENGALYKEGGYKIFNQVGSNKIPNFKIIESGVKQIKREYDEFFKTPRSSLIDRISSFFKNTFVPGEEGRTRYEKFKEIVSDLDSGDQNSIEVIEVVLVKLCEFCLTEKSSSRLVQSLRALLMRVFNINDDISYAIWNLQANATELEKLNDEFKEAINKYIDSKRVPVELKNVN